MTPTEQFIANARKLCDDISYNPQNGEDLLKYAEAEQALSRALDMLEVMDEAVNHAHAFLSAQNHGENCYLVSDPPSCAGCFCGLESAQSAIERKMYKCEQIAGRG